MCNCMIKKLIPTLIHYITVYKCCVIFNTHGRRPHLVMLRIMKLDVSALTLHSNTTAE